MRRLELEDDISWLMAQRPGKDLHIVPLLGDSQLEIKHGDYTNLEWQEQHHGELRGNRVDNIFMKAEHGQNWNRGAKYMRNDKIDCGNGNAQEPRPENRMDDIAA